MVSNTTPARELIHALQEGLTIKEMPVEDGWDVKPQPSEPLKTPIPQRSQEKDGYDVTQFG